jgi:transcriptional regulator with PAS, ATPase and Fis domain
MIEQVKSKLWKLLQAKEISLAMIFNREGEILWHRGRRIKGKTIAGGEGFSKSCLNQSIHNGRSLEEEGVVVLSTLDGLPESASYLNIKSLMILPLNSGIFLYLDSGIKESFTETDRQYFSLLGELLAELIDNIRRKQEDIGGITGTGSQVKQLRELVLKYSLEEDPVLLHGETGSGKNHVAGLVHRFSGRPGRFVTINTPGIPEELFESEIFGHAKGAFTGAMADKKGLVEEAEGGTLFFDEIAEVPPSFQARLLRFIETRKYFTLGCTEEKTADVRIVAATNMDLAEAIHNKKFREDLYFRLQVLEIKIPPLRERKEDIKPLVLEEKRVLKGKSIGPGFWEAVQNHDWPGNIRELKSVLKRAAIFAGETVTGTDVQNSIRQSSLQPVTVTGKEENHETGKIWAELKTGGDFWSVVKKPFLKRDINRPQAKEIINRALSEAGGKYVDVLPLFNLPRKEYHRFMAFLSDYKLK